MFGKIIQLSIMFRSSSKFVYACNLRVTLIADIFFRPRKCFTTNITLPNFSMATAELPPWPLENKQSKPPTTSSSSLPPLARSCDFSISKSTSLMASHVTRTSNIPTKMSELESFNNSIWPIGGSCKGLRGVGYRHWL